MDLELLRAAIALDEQEQQEHQQSTPECLHDFEYFNDYERACLKCSQIAPGSFLTTTSEHGSYRPRTNNKGAYLKKFITQHQDRHNCFVPYEVYTDFGKFQRAFIDKYPYEPTISIR